MWSIPKNVQPTTDGLCVTVEHSGSGVALQTLDYENPGSNPMLWC